MDIEYIIYDINKLINDHIEKTKYIVKTHFITDTEFRCISVFILGNSMDLLKFDAFKVELFKKFNLYISDFIEIEDGKTFNMFRLLRSHRYNS